MGRFRERVPKNAWMTAALGSAVAAAVGAAVTLTMRATGAGLGLAFVAVVPGFGWGGLTFACGYWLASRKRERVGADVLAMLAPLLKELKHLRAALAQRVAADEFAKTSVHPRRIPPPSDQAPTVVASFERVREVLR